MPKSAYALGQDAYHAGIELSKNPYRFGSTDFEMWAEGWRDAEFNDIENKTEE